MAITTYLSIITLIVNGLNVYFKRHRAAEWIQKTRPYANYKRPTSSWKTYKQSKGVKKDISAGVAILT